MKLHDLQPAEGSRKARTRVGRGIAAGKGKTAGRGTKGQRSRAGASIPAWFEGGQTPIHVRIPKLRGFRNINRIEYEVVNVGAIAQAIASGKLQAVEAGSKGRKAAPVTVNADLLHEAGLVTKLSRPLKILGAGELDVACFVLADAFTKSAREKIEGAGGTVQVIEVPSTPLAALGVEPEASDAPATPAAEAVAPVDTPEPAVAPDPEPEAPAAAETDEVAAEAAPVAEADTDAVEAAEPVADDTATADEPDA